MKTTSPTTLPGQSGTDPHPHANHTLDLEPAIVTLEAVLAAARKLNGLPVEKDEVDAIPGGRARRGQRAETSRELQWMSEMAHMAGAEIQTATWAYKGRPDPREVLYAPAGD